MNLSALSALAAKALPSGGGDISPMLDACTPEVIAALCRVAEASKRWFEAADRGDVDAMHTAAIESRAALSALESVGR